MGIFLVSVTFFFDFRYNKAGGQMEVITNNMKATDIDVRS
jgi:hypothetical protein